MKSLLKLALLSLLISASLSYATTVTSTLQITVVPQPLQITTSSLPPAQETIVYTPFQMQAIGGYPPYKWSLDPKSAPLPQGMQLTPDGVLSGTPAVGDAQSSPYTVIFAVTDSAPSGPSGAIAPPHEIKFSISKANIEQNIQQLPVGRSFDQLVSGE